tara:strand:+ start:469 stop:798 length:330 start_codon:yes stop_codon:yes gene_type:complete
MIESTKVSIIIEDGELISSEDYTSFEVEATLVSTRSIHHLPEETGGMGQAVFYDLESIILDQIQLHRSTSATKEPAPVGNEMPEFKEVKMMLRVKYENELELEKLWRME